MTYPRHKVLLYRKGQLVKAELTQWPESAEIIGAIWKRQAPTSNTFTVTVELEAVPATRRYYISCFKGKTTHQPV